VTLGVGVATEEGACLIVDSGRAVYRKDGTIQDVIVDDKLY